MNGGRCCGEVGFGAFHSFCGVRLHRGSIEIRPRLAFEVDTRFESMNVCQLSSTACFAGYSFLEGFCI